LNSQRQTTTTTTTTTTNVSLLCRPSKQGIVIASSYILMSLLPNGLSEKSSSDSGRSNCGGSGNNSDNSALISIGNTSFGFNFDSEEGTMNNSPRNSNSNSEEGDSDEGPGKARGTKRGNGNTDVKKTQPNPKQTPSLKPATVISGSDTSTTNNSSHNDAAEAAVAYLQSIANETGKAAENDSSSTQGAKRKAQENADNDSGGYNTDDEGKAMHGHQGSQDGTASGSADSDAGGEGQKGPRKKKRLDEMKREERNAREKERSFRISRQISELRGLLSSGGVIVPKGTKSSVLTEAANYIRLLQQHQYRSEIDRHQLVQQIQMIGGGALGQPAATAVRHVAAQNGVWSLGNFGGVPPKSAMMYHQQGAVPGEQTSDPSILPSQNPEGTVLPNKIDEPDYRYVFNSSTVGMAIASMGGAFIDCNKLFCQLSEFTKQEICSMTIFNLTARQDLQHAFDLISQMLSAPTDVNGNPLSSTCVLRGALKDRTDLGLSVTLIKGDDSVAKCFCVTLVLNPTSPYDTSRPMPATIEHVQANTAMHAQKDLEPAGLDQAPAYTTG